MYAIENYLNLSSFFYLADRFGKIIFRGDGYKVHPGGYLLRASAIRFHRYRRKETMKQIAKLLRYLQGWLPASQHHKRRHDRKMLHILTNTR